MRPLTAALAFALAAAVPAGAAPQRYALLVGVGRYDAADLGTLKYAEADVVALASVLRDAGYTGEGSITLLTHTASLSDPGVKPTGDIIRGKLQELAEKCKPGDSLLVALAGHGVQFAGDAESYFCPADATLDPDDKSSLIALGDIYKLLEACPADLKLLLVDACRNRPASRARVVGLESVTRPINQLPPGGSAAFFSCSAGERAYEHEKLGHGVFFHHVIEGLRGRADVDGDKQVTLPELELFVKKHTGAFVRKEFNQAQEPDLRNQTRGLAPLTRWDAPPRPWAGCTAEAAGDVAVKQLGLDQSGALLVDFVFPGGPAEAAGLMAGDIVFAVAGRPVRSVKQFDEMTDQHYTAGERATLGVARAGRRLELTLTFAAVPTDAEYVAMLMKSAGRADAQVLIGLAHQEGSGVRQDPAEAVKWLRKAADAGHAEAANRLGLCYDWGLGVEKDPAEAARWYRRAAERGSLWARLNLGHSYAGGSGVSKDEAEAVRQYRVAADRGVSDAQFALGEMYRNGLGVPQDEAEAVRWYRRAAVQELADGQNMLGVMYYDGLGVGKDEAEAIKWFRLAAEQGLAVARHNLGDAYADGRGVAQSDAEAVRWYRKAALQGYADAQNSLGTVYLEGKGVDQSDAEALRWYRKAAAQDLAWGQYNLGLMYAEGHGVAKDVAEAAKWYRKAADQGLADAQNRLGRLYEDGDGVPQNQAEAVKWYRKAAESGLAEAQYNLGSCYEEGRGVPKNKAEALKWYRKAADQGDDDAKAKVEELTKKP